MNRLLKLVLFVLLSKGAAQAAPSIMLEKSASYALNDTVYAYRVPTQDSAGVIRYYDVIIDLNVNTNGTIVSTANVSTFASPSVTTGVIQPGTYKVTGRTTQTCVVTNFTLTNGRIQSFFNCTDTAAPTSYNGQLSVATGTISAGHPFLNDLLLEKVNLYTDVATQTWGYTNGATFYIGSCRYYNGYPIGAKTNGSQIVLSTYYTGAAPYTYSCGSTLTKTP